MDNLAEEIFKLGVSLNRVRAEQIAADAEVNQMLADAADNLDNVERSLAEAAAILAENQERNYWGV